MPHVHLGLKAVDFFCGAGGMSYGLQAAGIQVLAGIDNAAECKATYLANIKDAIFIKHDITTLTAPSLARRLRIRRNDPRLVFAGCSPCQFWSKVRTDKSKSRKTAQLIRQFEKFIRYFRPGFVVVENVPGILLRSGETLLDEFVEFLDGCGYVWADGVVNANSYGVPQNRKRYLLVATRISNSIALPSPKRGRRPVVRSFLGVANGFQRIRAGHIDERQFMHTAAALSPNNLKRMKVTPKSGGRRDAWKLDKELQIPAYAGRDNFFRDVYGRMSWERPAPTITTRFNSFSNGCFGHPDEDRAISLREGATLQTFPKKYRFLGSTNTSITKQIGNAVPPELARRIGLHLLKVATDG